MHFIPDTVAEQVSGTSEEAMILLFGIMLLTLFMGMEIGTAMGFTGMVYILITWLGPSPIPSRLSHRILLQVWILFLFSPFPCLFLPAD